MKIYIKKIWQTTTTTTTTKTDNNNDDDEKYVRVDLLYFIVNNYKNHYDINDIHEI